MGREERRNPPRPKRDNAMNKSILDEMEELADNMRSAHEDSINGDITYDDMASMLIQGANAINELLGTVNAIRFMVNEYDPTDDAIEEHKNVIRARLRLIHGMVDQ